MGAKRTLMELRTEARKGLSETEMLLLQREDYIAFMVTRYGENFDSASRMVPFTQRSEEVYLKNKGGCKRAQAAKAAKSKKRFLEARSRSALATLRSSACILELAKEMRDDVLGDLEEKETGRQQKRTRGNLCKVCGQTGHYAKCCPSLDASHSDPYQRAERYRANSRERYAAEASTK